MRSTVFNILFYACLAVFVLIAAALTLQPSPRPIRAVMRTACHTVRGLMRGVMGIRIEVRGTPPAGQPVIIASKHQSWADGFMMMAVTGDINFIIGTAARHVSGDHDDVRARATRICFRATRHRHAATAQTHTHCETWC